jgi:hypothetical protein
MRRVRVVRVVRVVPLVMDVHVLRQRQQRVSGRVRAHRTSGRMLRYRGPLHVGKRARRRQRRDGQPHRHKKPLPHRM